MSFEKFQLLHQCLVQHEHTIKDLYELLQDAGHADECFTIEDALHQAQELWRQTYQELRG
jgi:hypothetical protein